MTERAPQAVELDQKIIDLKALEYYDAIMNAFNNISPLGKHQTISETQILIGDDKNFINLMGIGTDRLHLVMGKTPIESGHGHSHVDLMHILHLGHAVTVDSEDSKQDDRNEFDSWEVVIKTGEVNEVTYASHEWRAGEKKDERIHTSPSGGIQINNQAAVDGIEQLLPYINYSSHN